MVAINELSDKLKNYVVSQIDTMSKTNPMISFIKPLITRAVDKNFSKITKAIELISDENGKVDVEGILTEMTESLMTTESFTLKTSFVGDIEVGGGVIRLNIPMTSKKLVFDQADIQSFRDILTSK